jgi:plasmid stabilization system protein ParE
VLVVRAAARREIEEAAEWYEGREPDLGAAFVEAVEARIERVPQQFALVNPQEPYRRALVARFPYHVFFEVLDDRVVVIAVAHERRRPGYWRSRSSTNPSRT